MARSASAAIVGAARATSSLDALELRWRTSSTVAAVRSSVIKALPNRPRRAARIGSAFSGLPPTITVKCAGGDASGRLVTLRLVLHVQNAAVGIEGPADHLADRTMTEEIGDILLAGETVAVQGTLPGDLADADEDHVQLRIEITHALIRS